MSKQRKLSIGDRYDRLEIIEGLGVRQISGKPLRIYLCRCDCGNTVEVVGAQIGRGVKSCGCLQRDSREREIAPKTRFVRLEVVRKEQLIKGRGYMMRVK